MSDLDKIMIHIILKLYDTCKTLIANSTRKIKDFIDPVQM